jgi:hypothetical protein
VAIVTRKALVVLAAVLLIPLAATACQTNSNICTKARIAHVTVKGC